MANTKEFESYKELGPDYILDAVESVGFRCDKHIFALNSYENRVYQIGIEDEAPIIVKFYRPARWSDEAIIEEHQFTFELSQYEIPVIAPIVNDDGKSLYHYNNFRFAIYPRHGGRPPELENPDHLLQLGRFIGRIHNIGATTPYAHRPVLDIQSYGIDSYKYLLANNFIPVELENAYQTLAEDLIQRIHLCYERAGNIESIRLHGDCHHSNILWRDDTLFILDFDDARMGPAIQDLWMFLSGDRDYMTARLADLLEGYTEFRDFDTRELYLIEALRTLRMLHYNAWIARRWDDPAFPLAFPLFNTQHHWEDHILTLREQAALMDEMPLQWSST
ncbi:MAG: serine/threonine protein kinase [Gammaproteobacteria bacterium]